MYKEQAEIWIRRLRTEKSQRENRENELSEDIEGLNFIITELKGLEKRLDDGLLGTCRVEKARFKKELGEKVHEKINIIIRIRLLDKIIEDLEHFLSEDNRICSFDEFMDREVKIYKEEHDEKKAN